MSKVIWKDKIIAESTETVYIEGNKYFPPESVNKEFLVDSDLHTECFWKGTASYYSLKEDDKLDLNAAWYYPNPKPGSEDKVGHTFKDYVAFYPNIVTITD